MLVQSAGQFYSIFCSSVRNVYLTVLGKTVQSSNGKKKKGSTLGGNLSTVSRGPVRWN